MQRLMVSGLLAGLAHAGEIPFIDLAGEKDRQVVVDREEGQYLGHVSTCLLDDGKTILAVYPKGHGRGAIVYKRSSDGGRVWSERLETPESWATSREVPTLHRMTDADGKKRIIMWSGLYPARFAVTEDEGRTWSELKPAGDWGGIVVMGDHVELKTGKGHYMCLFHDDGRFFKKDGKRRNPQEFRLYKTLTKDGGLTWSFPEVILKGSGIHLCEPGAVRSPAGAQLAVLLRENLRRENSHVIFSEDEGATWTKSRQVPVTLTGDRHTCRYTPDGRLVIVFRGRYAKGNAIPQTDGDCVMWVGRYEDIVHGKPGQYLVRLLDNHKGHDTTYPGVEVLPDGTIVVTTYGHWVKGRQPFIMSTRLKLEELDAKAPAARPIRLSSDGHKVLP
ncbi:MAG: exo-alpha-sialidase [Akkermansiaceae bacterium]|nr:exo-alpha-sialidase [Akkermansiaceae bacterium]NNM28035.1 exo-alpha-sialidase [Akkermansiaceae bacterium]